MAVDESIFSIDVVTKATYWLSGRYAIDLQRDSAEGTIVVGISPPDRDFADGEARDIEARLRRDLIDFRTRALIEQETRVIRDLLVAKAFAHGDES